MTCQKCAGRMIATTTRCDKSNEDLKKRMRKCEDCGVRCQTVAEEKVLFWLPAKRVK